MEPTQEQIDAYVAHVQGLINAHWKQMGFTFADPSKVGVDMGPTYVRVWKDDVGQGKSVHTFIDRRNGDILKGSWKAPVKNGKRANIHEPGWEKAITHHGPVYLRR